MARIVRFITLVLSHALHQTAVHWKGANRYNSCLVYIHFLSQTDWKVLFKVQQTAPTPYKHTLGDYTAQQAAKTNNSY